MINLKINLTYIDEDDDIIIAMDDADELYDTIINQCFNPLRISDKLKSNADVKSDLNKDNLCSMTLVLDLIVSKESSMSIKSKILRRLRLHLDFQRKLQQERYNL